MAETPRQFGQVAVRVSGGHEQEIVPVGVRFGDSHRHQGIVNGLKT
jgi:hypothetical protein